MPRSLHAYLRDVIETCGHILEATTGMDADDYRDNTTVRRAVERDFQITGDALGGALRSDGVESVGRHLG